MERNQNPNSLHLSILASHVPVVDDLLSDLKAATERVKVSFIHPPLKCFKEISVWGFNAGVQRWFDGLTVR